MMTEEKSFIVENDQSFFHGCCLEDLSTNYYYKNLYVTKRRDVAENYSDKGCWFQLVLELNLNNVEIEEDKPEKYEVERDQEQFIIKDQIDISAQLVRAYLREDGEKEWTIIENYEQLVKLKEKFDL